MATPDEHVIILVIEDDPLIRTLLTDVLTDEGYMVVAAENSEQALTTITTISPGLITLDLDLSGISGDLILAELRRRDETRELPIVLVTATAPVPPDLRRLAQAIVPKPFHVDKLLTVIRKLLPPPEPASVGE
jgi:two-component system, OmpR family, phosphate regulon response regulator PhoB